MYDRVYEYHGVIPNISEAINGELRNRKWMRLSLFEFRDEGLRPLLYQKTAQPNHTADREKENRELIHFLFLSSLLLLNQSRQPLISISCE